MNIAESIIKHPLRYGLGGIIFLLTTFAYYFRKADISNSVQEWGQFGDYIGGLLNPLLGFISVVLVAATLRSQTQAARLQEFENQFFALLNLHSSVVQGIDRKMKDKTIMHGRDCFRFFYRKIVSISQRDRVQMGTAYQKFIEQDGWEIEHYFRTVYHMFKHVKDGHTQIEVNDLQRKRYYDLIKSQLSQYELVLLWFNVQSINKGNWDAILREPGIEPFEHLNRTNLIENPPPVSADEADA